MQFIDLEKYNYKLPTHLIRNVGVEPRHNAKLFIYNTKTNEIKFDVFLNIHKYLPQNAHLILNETKVLPVRIKANTLYKGKVEIFFLLNEWRGDKKIPCFLDKKNKEGEEKIFYFQNYSFYLKKENGKNFIVKILRDNFPEDINESFVKNFLDKYGETPVPRYLSSNQDEKKLRQRYQTIFAKDEIDKYSVAAPTASLHFTDQVFENLLNLGIKIYYVNLAVGRGTFANLKEENLKEKKLHHEWYSIAKNTQDILNQKLKGNLNHSIVAVGTTSVRTLETYARNLKREGETDIFIMPGEKFYLTDIMITNFHLPKTSLMLLVDAFLQNKNAKYSIVDLYKIAIKNDFCFYSFGDSMLIL